jgi:hypothetical protein
MEPVEVVELMPEEEQFLLQVLLVEPVELENQMQ